MKTLTCSLLILSLALLALTASYAQEETDIEILRAADVNADGTINILDLVLIASHFGEPVAEAQTPNPDVNGDGSVNVLDLVLVANRLGETVRPPAAFVSAAPESGTVMTTNDSITLTFDNPPQDVTVSTGTAAMDENTVTIEGPFTPGALELTITWGDGTETLSYTVRPLAAFVSAAPENDVEITTEDSITLTFDNPPTDVTVSTGVAMTDGNSVKITGPFTPGALELTITWADGTETLAYTVRPIAAFTSADPESGVEITTEDNITLTFDNPPEDVTVSEGTPTTDENTVTIAGPFTTGELELTITWADGTETLSYTVIELDTEAPSITSGTVSDGDTDVDANATIEIVFSEEVRGLVTLRTESDDNVGWITTFDGNKVMLTPVAGKELAPETTYVITGKVRDAANNGTELNITFTTASAYDGIPIEITDANFDTVVLGSEVPIVVEFYTDW